MAKWLVEEKSWHYNNCDLKIVININVWQFPTKICQSAGTTTAAVSLPEPGGEAAGEQESEQETRRGPIRRAG